MQHKCLPRFLNLVLRIQQSIAYVYIHTYREREREYTLLSSQCVYTHKISAGRRVCGTTCGVCIAYIREQTEIQTFCLNPQFLFFVVSLAHIFRFLFQQLFYLCLEWRACSSIFFSTSVCQINGIFLEKFKFLMTLSTSFFKTYRKN